MGRISIVLMIALVGIAPTNPVTAAPTQNAKRLGKQHSEKALKEYKLGRFSEAIAEFQQAYEVDPAPIYLFNIAQAYRQIGNNDRAIFFYRRYLEDAPQTRNRAAIDEAQALEAEAPLETPPKTSNKAAVENKIAELQAYVKREQDGKKITDNDAVDSPVTSPQEIPVDSPYTPLLSDDPISTEASRSPSDSGKVPASHLRRNLRIAGLATGITGGVCLLTGAIFGIRAKSKGDEITSSMRFNANDESAGRRAQSLQWVFYEVGAAALVSGTLLYYFGTREQGKGSSYAFVPTWNIGKPGASLVLTY
jgi:tetratricopeptide (TPR) repeat protein